MTDAPFFDRKALMVGATVFIGHNEGELIEAQVCKVGRQYFTATWTGPGYSWVNEETFAFLTGAPKGRFHKNAWPSIEFRDAFVSVKKIRWETRCRYDQFKNDLPWSIPDGVTIADIEEVERLLQIRRRA